MVGTGVELLGVTMTEVEMKYGFPLFSLPSSKVSLGKNEKLVISDIWAFWDYVIKKASKDKKEENFLQSLLEQAKHFYATAVASPVKSQPLLYYYSFLNFAKVLINIDHSHGPGKRYVHGMNERNHGKFLHSTVTKAAQTAPVVQVAHELISIFDPSITTTDLTLNVRELLTHCVGVHRAYSEIYGKREAFFRIKNDKLYKSGKQLIYKAELLCEPSDVAALQAAGYMIQQETIEEKNYFFYVETQAMASYSPTRSDYANLSAAIHSRGIWYFIGNNGYTKYISNSTTARYSQEAIIYMVMFYLGSITRYHPYLFDEIFSEKEQWLMSEFLNTQPKQFLYLATARVLGQSVVKAYASF